MNLEPAQPRENISPQAPIPSPAISTWQGLLRSLGNHIFFPEIVGNHSALKELRNLACAQHSDVPP